MPLIPDFNFFNINFFSSYVKQLRNWCTFFGGRLSPPKFCNQT